MNNAGNRSEVVFYPLLKVCNSRFVGNIAGIVTVSISVFLVALQHVLYLFVIVDQDRAPDDCQFHTCLNGKSKGTLRRDSLGPSRNQDYILTRPVNLSFFDCLRSDSSSTGTYLTNWLSKVRYAEIFIETELLHDLLKNMKSILGVTKL